MFAIVDIETIKEIYPHWANLRTSNDGSKVVIHRSILDAFRPNVSTMMLNEGEEEPPYPFPLVSGEEINNMEEFKSKEETL